MTSCGVCKEAVLVSHLPLSCMGGCSRQYHPKCVGIGKPTAKVMQDLLNIMFKCNDCLSVQSEFVSDAAKGENRMEEIPPVSFSLGDIPDRIAAQIDAAARNGMELIKASVNNLLKEQFVALEKLVSEKMENFSLSFFESNRENVLAAMNGHSDNAAKPGHIDLMHAESVRSQRKKKKNKPDVNDSEANKQVLSSQEIGSVAINNHYRDNSANLTGEPCRRTRPVIIIKPKESTQSSEATREFLKSTLDPRTSKIRNFRPGKEGSIIAECATDNVDEVKNGIESNLGESYHAVVPSLPVPRLKVMGLSDQLSADDFIDFLKSQNDEVQISEVKVLRVYEIPRFTYRKFNAIIEVNKETYHNLLRVKFVNVKWDRCRVVPAINVLRCFHCGEFGHKSSGCHNHEVCSLCSGEHRTSECTSTVLKCVNCSKVNKERKLNLDVNHAAFSADCSVYKRLYDQKKGSLHFNK